MRSGNNIRLEGSLFEGIRPIEGDTAEMIRALFEWRADAGDVEMRSRLLRKLIVGYADSQRELMALNSKLVERQRQLDQDLLAAARIQKSFLPHAACRKGNFQFAWKFEPCERVGGDIFNVFSLDETHAGFYMLDVSGHGVPSALLTVSISQNLQPQNSDYTKRTMDRPPYYEIVPPGAVLQRLNADYSFDRFEKFLSIFYAVINTREGTMTYSNAGHPPPVLVRDSQDAEMLEAGGPLIGLGPTSPFMEGEKRLGIGEKLIVYTDGVTEARNSFDEFFGPEGLHAVLAEHGRRPVEEILERIYSEVVQFGAHEKPRDDISMLGVEFVGVESGR